MTDDFFQGYKGEALEVLKKFNTRVWGQAVIETTRGRFTGTILPRAENDDDKHIVLKIPTGYNVGVDIRTINEMKETGYKKAVYQIPEKEFPITPGLPNVKLFGTGGTIASRLDYRTGAVIPAFSPGELYGAVPELADICNLNPEQQLAASSICSTASSLAKRLITMIVRDWLLLTVWRCSNAGILRGGLPIIKETACHEATIW